MTRIGFVYDLREDYLARGFSLDQVAEFDTPECLEGVEHGLRASAWRCDVDHVGDARKLAERLVAGERWDLVFSIAEGVRGRSREAQVPALCELFEQPYAFSDPLTMAATLDKGVAKALARDAGVATAPFAVLEYATEAEKVDLDFPLFVKPVAEGTGKGCEAASKVLTRAELRDAADRLIWRFRQPVIAEGFLPGREFTVGIVGTGRSARVIAVMEILFREADHANIYSLEVKEDWEDRVDLRIVEDDEARHAEETALAAYRALGCRDAGRVDLRSDGGGRPNFLEVNPIAGLHPTHSDLPILTRLSGRSYEWLLGEILASAFARQGRQRPFRGKESERAA